LILGDQKVQVFASRRKVDQAVGDHNFGSIAIDDNHGLFANTLTHFVEEKDESEEYDDDDQEQIKSMSNTLNHSKPKRKEKPMLTEK